MENNTKKTSPLVYFLLTFITAVFFELYWINNHPYDYFMLIGIGLVVLITGYLSFDGIIKMKTESEELKREQNETMIKAQKAIYLATKKNAAEAENMQIQSLKAVNVLMDRMVETITAKQIEAKSSYGEPKDLSGLINELTESNAKLAREVQNAVTVNELVKANESLIKNVQNVLNGNPVDLSESYSAPAVTPVGQAAASSIITETEQDAAPSIIAESEPDVASSIIAETEPDVASSIITETEQDVVLPPVAESEPAVTPSPIITPEPVILPEPSTMPVPTETPETFPEELPTKDTFENPDDADDMNDTINIDEMTLEELDEINPSPLYDFPEYDDSADFTTEKDMDDDIAGAEAAVADVSQTIEAIEAASELEAELVDFEADELENAMYEDGNDEAVADESEVSESEDADSSVSEKDPNAALTPEEIAALFANL